MACSADAPHVLWPVRTFVALFYQQDSIFQVGFGFIAHLILLTVTCCMCVGHGRGGQGESLTLSLLTVMCCVCVGYGRGHQGGSVPQPSGDRAGASREAVGWGGVPPKLLQTQPQPGGIYCLVLVCTCWLIHGPLQSQDGVLRSMLHMEGDWETLISVHAGHSHRGS